MNDLTEPRIAVLSCLDLIVPQMPLDIAADLYGVVKETGEPTEKNVLRVANALRWLKVKGHGFAKSPPHGYGSLLTHVGWRVVLANPLPTLYKDRAPAVDTGA